MITLHANGTIEGIDNSNFNSSLPAGHVLQVVQTIKKDLFETSQYSGQGYTLITGLAASITPTSASSKILVMANIVGSCTRAKWSGIRLYKGGNAVTDAISTGATWGSAPTDDGHKTNNNFITIGYNPDNTHGDNIAYNQSAQYLDTAGSASEITYDLRICGRENGTTSYINKGVITASSDATIAGVSTLTLTEISV